MEQGPRASLDPAFLTQLPADAFALLSTWRDDMDISIDFRDWLDGGHSRASVALIRLRGVRPERNAVLKYCPTRGGEPQPDFKAFRKASRSGPQGFAPSHLVPLDETMSRGPIRNSGASSSSWATPPERPTGTSPCQSSWAATLWLPPARRYCPRYYGRGTTLTAPRNKRGKSSALKVFCAKFSAPGAMMGSLSAWPSRPSKEQILIST
jgi:hypothetical protein